MKRFICLTLLAASAALAQTSPPQPGFESEWDLKKLLESLTSGARRLQPLMEQVDPKNWSDKQAAASYSPQWKSAQSEIQYLNTTAQSFAKQPERLTLALETYFRLQSIQAAIASLSEGIRKYQNPAVADLLQGAVMENLNNRERLKSYVTELAQTKEQELKIMDSEAQRCRGTLSKQPPPPSSRTGRKQ